MSDPIALQVLDELEDRLLAIDGTGAFHNDVGQRVYIGAEYQDSDHPGDLPYIAIIEGGDDPFEADVEATLIQETGNYIIQGICKVQDRSKPLRDGHLLLADLKRALLLKKNGPEMERLPCGATLDYTGRQIFEREPGGRLCEVHALFRVRHGELYGNPDTRNTAP